MKFSSVFVCVFLLAIYPVHADNADAISSAKDATLAWLALADQGRYEESWNSAALMFQAAITQSDWDRSLNAVRTPLGGVMTREVGSSTFATTLPGAPDGEYVVFQFNTSFENKASAVETVTAMKQNDGAWRVAGYFIK